MFCLIRRSAQGRVAFKVYTRRWTDGKKEKRLLKLKNSSSGYGIEEERDLIRLQQSRVTTHTHTQPPDGNTYHRERRKRRIRKHNEDRHGDLVAAAAAAARLVVSLFSQETTQQDGESSHGGSKLSSREREREREKRIEEIHFCKGDRLISKKERDAIVA